jgi:hypothetical protein
MDVIQAQKQEKSTPNPLRAQPRNIQIQPEKKETTEGSSKCGQPGLGEAISAPETLVNGRRIYRTKNGLMSYKPGKSGPKRGENKEATKVSNVTRPTTPPPKAHSPSVKPRAYGSPKEKSPTIVRKRKKSEADPEERGTKSEARSSAVSSDGPEVGGRTKKFQD